MTRSAILYTDVAALSHVLQPVASRVCNVHQLIRGRRARRLTPNQNKEHGLAQPLVDVVSEG